MEKSQTKITELLWFNFIMLHIPGKFNIGGIYKRRRNTLGGEGVSNSDVARYYKVEFR